MPAPLSIIIPTLNSATDLGATLEPLLEGRARDVIGEVIVSDGGSSDETADLAKKLGTRFIMGARGRGGQLQRGAVAASGTWLLFLHADTRLETGWSDAVMAHIFAFPDQAGCFRLQFQAHGVMPWIVAAWANARTRLFGLPYGDQGLLLSRHIYEQIGGYEDIPLMEDVAIARALKGQIKLMKCRAITNPAKFEQNGWVRQGARNFGALARYFMGVSPGKLARRYDR